MPLLLRASLVVLTLLYPLAVYVGLQQFDARQLVLLLLVLAVVRLFSLGSSPLNHWGWIPLIALLGLWAWWGNTDIALKFYPVLVNMSLLTLFVWSLANPPSVVERLARLKEPDLPERAVVYTRGVTVAWSIFFFSNGSVALMLALYGTNAQWALYNGLISYILMGIFFIAEWLLRQYVMSHDG